ncbi:MAG TPA: NAD(P)-binding domain-containing protein [Chitinispirillaceae bacterium]|nr:NAD(P)-binding domain-containing protein [Chitinispirillaceae bacterium]
MNIGIIGSGHIGSILAELWTRHGHRVMISSRHPDKLDTLAQKIGPDCQRGSVEQAAQFGETVVLSIPLGQLESVISKTDKYLHGKVVIDTMNPCVERDGDQALDIITRNIASAVATQLKLSQSKVVRAFCSICFFDLKTLANRLPNTISVPFASDDESAKLIIMQLINDAGFQPYYLGPLHLSKPLDPGGKIFGKALTRSQIEDLLFYKEFTSKDNNIQKEFT